MSRKKYSYLSKVDNQKKYAKKNLHKKEMLESKLSIDCKFKKYVAKGLNNVPTKQIKSPGIKLNLKIGRELVLLRFLFIAPYLIFLSSLIYFISYYALTEL